MCTCVFACEQGFIPPANPTEVEHSHVFVFNNIFFSYAADSPDAYKAVSGEAAARKSASQVCFGFTGPTCSRRFFASM